MTDLTGPSVPSVPRILRIPRTFPVIDRRGMLGPVLLLGMILAGFAAASWWEEAHVDAPAPGFALVSTGFENGTLGAPTPFTLEEYRGRTVVLDFMAVACTSCRIVTEDVLKPLQSRHPDLVILSIDTWSDPGAGNYFGGESDADIIELQRETGVGWRHARDTDQVYLKYAAIGLPKLVVVDPDGNVAYSKVGTQDLGRVEAAVQASIAGQAQSVPLLRLGLGGLAFVAGAACIVTPCGVGLLPAYFALLLEDSRHAPTVARAARAVRGSLAAAAGIVGIYALFALLFWWQSDAMARALPWLGPLVGLMLVVVGVMAWRGMSWAAVARLLGAGRIDGRRGFVAFGAAYGVAGFACTGPLFLPILVAGFLDGPTSGLLVFALYALAVAAGLTAAGLLVAFGHTTRLSAFLDRVRHLHRFSAALLVIAGVAVIAYAAKAYGLV